MKSFPIYLTASVLLLSGYVCYNIGLTVGVEQSKIQTPIVTSDYIQGVKACYVDQLISSIVEPNICEPDYIGHWYNVEDDFDESDYYSKTAEFNNGYN